MSLRKETGALSSLVFFHFHSKVKCGVRGDTGPACNVVGMIDRKILGIQHLYRKPVFVRTKVSLLQKQWLTASCTNHNPIISIDLYYFPISIAMQHQLTWLWPITFWCPNMVSSPLWSWRTPEVRLQFFPHYLVYLSFQLSMHWEYVDGYFILLYR